MLIDWFTVGAQAVNFLILVWLLKRFLYKPVLAAVDEREKRITAELENADQKKAEALKEQTSFLHQKDEFERQRLALLLEATNSGKKERDQLLEAARTDTENLRSKSKKAWHDELNKLNQNIGTLAVEEVFSIARKTLADLADTSLEERVTEIFIHRLQGMNGELRAGLTPSLHSTSGPVLVRSAFELGTPQKKAIEQIVGPIFGEATAIDFQTKPDLISGIELTANGQKIAWSIADYLTSLKNSMKGSPDPDFIPAPLTQKAIPDAA
jgi:F-type H+-transporting ATPase subunit b